MQLDVTCLNKKVLIAARRVLTRNRLQVWFRALLAGSLFCLVLVTLSRFVYIPRTFAIALTALVISAAAGLVLALRRKGSPFEGAAELDSLLDLKERLATATELQEKGEITEPLARSQLAESVRISKSVNPTVVRIGLPKEAPLTIFSLILCASVALIAPLYSTAGTTTKDLQMRESIRLQLARQSLQEEKSALAKGFQETAQEIEKGKLREAHSSLAALIEDLSREHSKAAEKERVLAELESYPQLAKVAQALRQNSPEALSRESERLSSDGAGAANTTQILKDIAQDISQDTVFKNLLEQFAKAIEMRNQKELEEALKSLATSLQHTGSAQALSGALATAEVTKEKITEALGGAITGRAPGRTAKVTSSLPAPSSAERSAAFVSSGETEQAIVKQNVPERFKQIVRGYFSRE
jgi:hypothetical protein